MKRCLRCQKLSVEYDPFSKVERCLWNSCLWVNKDNIDLDSQPSKPNFDKFKKAIKIKKAIAAKISR